MRCRGILAVCLLVLCFSPSIAAARNRPDPADAVRAADQAWMKVFAAKDLESSVTFCDENGAVLGANAPIANGREAIRKSFASFFALPNLKISWHPDRVSVAKSGELGYTSGAYEMTFTDPSGKTIPDKGKYVTIWKKEAGGNWKVMLDIFNTDLPPGGGQ